MLQQQERDGFQGGGAVGPRFSNFETPPDPDRVLRGGVSPEQDESLDEEDDEEGEAKRGAVEIRNRVERVTGRKDSQALLKNAFEPLVGGAKNLAEAAKGSELSDQALKIQQSVQGLIRVAESLLKNNNPNQIMETKNALSASVMFMESVLRNRTPEKMKALQEGIAKAHERLEKMQKEGHSGLHSHLDKPLGRSE